MMDYSRFYSKRIPIGGIPTIGAPTSSSLRREAKKNSSYLIAKYMYYTMRLAEYLLVADAQIDCYTMQRGGRLYHFGIGGSL